METLSPDLLVFFRSRWNRDLINRVVIALNDGLAIEPYLAGMPDAPESPRSSGYTDLRGIDFSHQNLRGPWKRIQGRHMRTGVSLAHADLRGADLSWALLPRADLKGALLCGVNMSHCELIMADLSGTDLRNADLTGVWLHYTRFHDSRVTESQLAERRNLGQLELECCAYEK